MINRIYGILRGTARVPEDMGYRYSDATRNRQQEAALRFLTHDINESELGIFLDFVLQLLSCSPYWPDVIRDFDPENSYEISVIPELDPEEPSKVPTLSVNPMLRLVEWEATIPDSGDTYRTTAECPLLDRICAKLFHIITGK